MIRTTRFWSTAAICSLVLPAAFSSHAQNPPAPVTGETTESIVLDTDIELFAPDRPYAKAYHLSTVNDFVPGNLADGYIGDIALQNEYFKAIIARPTKPLIGSVRGGSLIDVTLNHNTIDFFSSLNTTIDPLSTGSIAIYTGITSPHVESDTTATVTLSGYIGNLEAPRPSADELIKVETRYSVPKGKNALTLVTNFHNTTSQTAWLRPADIIDWGEGRTFGERTGYGVTTSPVNYIIASAPDFAMGYYISGTQPMEGYHFGRDSIFMAAGNVETLQRHMETLKAIAEANTGDNRVPKEFQAVGGSLTERPGYVVFPGTEKRAILSMSGMPELAPIYVPEGVIQYVDGEATISLSQDKLSRHFTAPPDNEKATYIELAPGVTYQYTRHITVTDGNWATIVRDAHQTRGHKLATIAGVVVDNETGSPLADVQVRVNGGPGWDGISPSQPLFQVKTREDGSFAASVPEGQYICHASITGRVMLGKPNIINAQSGAPLTPSVLQMSKESRLLVAVSEAETITSSPLPVKLTLIAKPPYPQEDYGISPDVTNGIQNTYYLPQGAAVLPVTPGRYRLIISRGIEYDIHQQDILVTPGQEQRILASLPHVMRGYITKMVSMDAGLMTDNSSMGYATAESRAIQAACEGVSVIISGDYNQATDLQTAIRNQGLERHVKAFAGRRVLLHKGNMSADLFVYPLTPETNEKLDATLKEVDGLAPDIALSDLRKALPNVIIEIARPTHPEAGYMNSFPFQERQRQFTDGVMPPPDFNAFQILEGKKIGQDQETYDRYMAMQLARMSADDLHKGAPISPTGSSSSRLSYGQDVGYPRTYLYLDNEKPLADVTADDVLKAIRGQHFLVTNGPVLLFDAVDNNKLEFSVQPGDIMDLQTTDVAKIRARVLCAPWVNLFGVNTRENGIRGVTVAQIRPSEEIVRYPTNAGNVGGHIYSRYLKSDHILDAYAYSHLRTLEPVVSDPLLDFGGKMYPFAWSGPIFVDRDGDGKITIKPKEP